jgi:hydrogenase maturation protease
MVADKDKFFSAAMNDRLRCQADRENLLPYQSSIGDRPTILVIGYGNDLRNDDGVGQAIAKTIAKQNRLDVRSLSLCQLTPELAADIAIAELVIFVDAYPASPTQGLQTHSLEPLSSGTFRSHSSDPQGLLTLARTVFGRCPTAWLIAVPGVDFELGDKFSSTAEQGMTLALEQIDSLVKTHQSPLAS